MEKANMGNTGNIDPNLENLIKAMVDEKVQEKIGSVDDQISGILDRLDKLKQGSSNRATIVAFSGDMDKLIAAFIISIGAAAMDMEVSMFFTFWGITALKKQTIFSGKPLVGKMMAAMLPGGPDNMGTSKMNMMGMGPRFFKMVMKQHNAQSLPELIEVARELEIRFVACEMSMGIMGISKDEMIDGVEYAGVATYLADAGDSKITLFI